ncbi:hypothetical protein [Mycolicibacterium agri]|nr:hypothetical protein [Mycolicibacterium agri]
MAVRRTMLAALFAMVLCAPVAAAEPIAPPEVPPEGGVVFTDNPALLDPHPMHIESWSRAAQDDAVLVHFTSGPPECTGVHATAQETPSTVTVDLRGGTPPEAIGRACIMIALRGTLEVPLQAPLGDRQVLSAH